MKRSIRSLGVVGLYLAATIGLTWPLLPRFMTDVPAVFLNLDALLQSYILGWDWRSLGREPLNIFNAPVFHPEPLTLTYMDHLIGEAIFSAPVYFLTGRHAAGYNWILMTSFVLSGWVVYRLARYMGASRPASCLAGYFFAFMPYRFTNLGNLNLLQTQLIPLALLASLRLLEKGRVRDTAGLVAVLVGQVWYSSWYYTYYVLLSLAILLLVRPGRDALKWSVAGVRQAAVAVLVFLACVSPVVLPYVVQTRQMASYHRPLEKISRAWVARPMDYFRVNENNWLLHSVSGLVSERGYLPGLVVLPLALAGIVILRSLNGPGRRLERQKQFTVYFLILSAFSAVMSVGPFLPLHGLDRIPLPYWFFHKLVPGFSVMRAPGRFALMVTLSAVMIAAFSFDWLVLRFRLHERLRMVFFGVCVLLTTIASIQRDLPFEVLPEREAIPPVYRWVEQLPEESVILELPMPGRELEEKPEHALRQFYALFHEKRRLDGVSAFVSNEYELYRDAMRSFPDSLSMAETAEREADYIICHFGDYEPDSGESLRRAIAGIEALKEVAAFGSDVVYRFDRRTTGSR